MPSMILIQHFLNICLLRASPADIPTSTWLLNVSLLAYFIVGAVVSSIDYGLTIGLMSSLADTVVMMLACWILLKIRSMPARYMQTLTAMAGTGSILGIVAYPVLWMYQQVGEQGQLSSLVLLAVLVLVFWSVMVTAHIFRQALEIKAGTAAVITVAYSLASLIIVGLAMSGVV